MAKRSGGKPGPGSVNPSSRGSTPLNTSGGTPGMSKAQGPIPGPGSSGGPVALKRALAKKSSRGSDATGAAGMRR
jgi:hypothetical protein